VTAVLDTCDFEAVLLVNRENSGYFRGLNVGLQYALVTTPTFAVVSNNDLLFADNFLDTLGRLRQEADVFVVCPRIRTASGEDQNPYYRDRPTAVQRFFLRLYFSSYSLGRVLRLATAALRWRARRVARSRCTTEQYIWAGHGSCYILTPSWFEHVRLLPSALFLIGEEFLLAELVALFGGRELFAPGLEVTHNEHGSTMTVPTLRYYELARSSYATYRRYF
jgi:GT2 family glycosyltransferase